MSLGWGREICGDLAQAESRERLCANGIQGIASGTVTGDQPLKEQRHPPAVPGPGFGTRVLAGILGVAMLTFGLLKLGDPFRGWYATQLSASGLPAFLYPVGIASEVIDGVLLVWPWLLPPRHREIRRILWSVGSIGLIGIMLVAVYVHLQPGVPAAVLPGKIKPPLIPVSMLLMAAWTFFAVRRFDRRSPSRLGVTSREPAGCSTSWS